MPTRTPAAPHVAAALRDTVPIVLSVAPFALVVGASATTIGLPALPGLSVAATVFAGRPTTRP